MKQLRKIIIIVLFCIFVLCTCLIKYAKTIPDPTNTPTLTLTNTPVPSITPTSTITPYPTITPTKTATAIPLSVSVETLLDDLKNNEEQAIQKYEGKNLEVTGRVYGLTFRGARGGIFDLTTKNDITKHILVSFDVTQANRMKYIEKGNIYKFIICCDTVGLYSGYLCRLIK